MSASYILFATTPPADIQKIAIKSPAFANMGTIPRRYTSDGANINPPLVLDKIPDETRSMVMLVEGPNAPIGTWVHWLLWDILPTTKINEATIPGIEGLNSFMEHHYKGPCPPAGPGNYFFKIYALNTVLRISCHSTKHEIMKAMKGHIVGYGQLVGTYTRNNVIQIPCTTASGIYC